MYNSNVGNSSSSQFDSENLINVSKYLLFFFLQSKLVMQPKWEQFTAIWVKFNFRCYSCREQIRASRFKSKVFHDCL